nr:helicase C-terminal domain-containing protein [Acinetobacter terrae]
MIKEAEKYGPTLVLTYSFEESRLIQQELKQIGVYATVQAKGLKLMECLPEFINNESQILVTPSAWDGLNLRTQDNEQLVKNIIITRIPNQPKNILEEYVAREHMISRNLPQHIADNLLWMKHRNHAIRTLKQGLGRGVRSPSDKVTVWIADPRMPRANSPKAKPLINAIPVRFLENYAKAKIFEVTGELVTPWQHQDMDIVL